jgi:hypothetical protein
VTGCGGSTRITASRDRRGRQSAAGWWGAPPRHRYSRRRVGRARLLNPDDCPPSRRRAGRVGARPRRCNRDTNPGDKLRRSVTDFVRHDSRPGVQTGRTITARTTSVRSTPFGGDDRPPPHRPGRRTRSGLPPRRRRRSAGRREASGSAIWGRTDYWRPTGPVSAPIRARYGRCRPRLRSVYRLG